MSPTAPLRIRNKTPSPTKGIQGFDDTPKIGLGVRSALPPIPQAAPTTTSLPNRPRPAPPSDYPAISDIMISPRTIVSPPPVRPSSVPVTAPLSPRPHGPRSPGIGSSLGMGRPANPPVPGMGSSHTTLRVMSGNGRRISPSRETIPLKGGDAVDLPSRPGLNTSQAGSTTPTPTPRVVSNKRQHSSDHLTPRKRSPSKSPAVMREEFGDENVNVDEKGLLRGQMSDPLKVPSLNKKSALGSSVGESRRSSGVSNGNTTPRRSSGPLTTPRTVSGATTSSVVSTATVESTVTEKVYGSKYGETVRVEHNDCPSAVEATRIKVRGGFSGRHTREADVSRRLPSLGL